MARVTADGSLSTKVAGELLGDRYRLGREIARGGMGVVHEAEHTTLGHRVAVKFLTEDGASDPSRSARFLREARAAASLKSPHVAKVIDFGTSNGRPFLVMERLEGEDLATMLDRRGALGVAEAISLVRQVCEAMTEAHARGIVHRDLKAANVFVTTSSDGQPFVKVLDFGLAKVAETAVSTRTSSHLVFGTPQYMSPEQLRSSSAVDARADVWSIGVLLYQLVAGEPPFVGPNLSTVIASVLTEAPRPLAWARADVPDELEDVVLRCLAKDPRDRPSSAADVARLLAAVPSEPYRDALGASPLERTSENPVAFTPRDETTTLWPVALPTRSWVAVACLLVLLGVGFAGARARVLAAQQGEGAAAAAAVSARVDDEEPASRPELEIAPTKLAERAAWSPPKEKAPAPHRAEPVKAPKAPCPYSLRKVKLASR